MRWRLAGPAEKARRAVDVGELVCEESEDQRCGLLWASGGHGTRADWVGGVSAHRTRSEWVQHAICAKWECNLACCAAGGIGCHLRRGEVHVV
jgi:hypothetical protein